MSDGNRNHQDQQDDGERQDRQGQQNQQGQQSQQNQGPSTAEKVLTVISVAFAVLLFSYVAWQAVQPPDGTQPQVEVVGTDEAANGSVVVHVELTNPGNAGLISATAEASCGQPPPDVTFEYVPAGGREQGVLVCPLGTTRPDVSVSAWVPA